jgi:arylsulfatase A-like enzyme
MRLALARGELPIAYPQTVQELREAMARYWGLVTLVDEMVGRVMERLRELGLEQNTIVVFTSEHGEMMGDHRLMSKMNSYEEAAKVPFLLSVPGLWDRSRRIRKPVSQVDVTPTLLDLMGQPLPDHLQGESWAEYLRTGREFPDRDILVVGDEPGYAPPWNARHIYQHRTLITPDGWKLTVSSAGDGELYHLGRDPKEMRNLYFLPEYQDQVRKIWDRLRARQKQLEDPVVLDLNQPWPQRRGGQRKFP